MKVVKYSEFALNESTIDSVRYTALLEEMDSEYLRMVQEGKTIDEINEGLWDLIGKLGGGFTDRQASDHLNLAFKINSESFRD